MYTYTHMYTYTSIYVYLFHSFVDGHLLCFYILPIVNYFPMNIVVHLSFQISDFIFFFFSYITWNGISRSHSSYSFLIFWGNFIVFSIRTAPFSVSPHPCQHLLFVVGLTLAILQVWGDTLWFWFTFLSWLLI